MTRRNKSLSAICARLRSRNDQAEAKGFVRKGFVPLHVGTNDEAMERICIPLKLINHPCFVYLLDQSAKEFGYNQEGLLRISCDVDKFKDILDSIWTRQ